MCSVELNPARVIFPKMHLKFVLNVTCSCVDANFLCSRACRSNETVV